MFELWILLRNVFVKKLFLNWSVLLAVSMSWYGTYIVRLFNKKIMVSCVFIGLGDLPLVFYFLFFNMFFEFLFSWEWGACPSGAGPWTPTSRWAASYPRGNPSPRPLSTTRFSWEKDIFPRIVFLKYFFRKSKNLVCRIIIYEQICFLFANTYANQGKMLLCCFKIIHFCQSFCISEKFLSISARYAGHFCERHKKISDNFSIEFSSFSLTNLLFFV